MSTSMTISIGFFAVAAIVVLIALGWVLVNKRKQHRHAKANEIRERAKDEALQVDRRDALAEEDRRQGPRSSGGRRRQGGASLCSGAASRRASQRGKDLPRSGRRATGPRRRDRSGVADAGRDEVGRSQVAETDSVPVFYIHIETM